jgi:C1A family cysteine protease
MYLGTKYSENQLLFRDIVASVGPVSAMMCVQPSFFYYESGVYYQENCCETLNHAVLITGYGTDQKEGDYW